MNTITTHTKSRQYLTHGLVAAVALWSALATFAADSTTATSQADRKEASFIKEAAQGNEAEVQMGQLGAEKGQNAEIKKLGQRLQQDHAKANQDLTQVAQKLGVTLPAEPTRKENRMTEKLQDKTSADFDKAFAERALTDHEKDITKFEKALQDVKDPELKAYIEKCLPVLREHLQMARTAGAAVGVSERTLAATDRFLSKHQGLGTAAGSETGAGTKGSSTETDSTTPTKPDSDK